MIPIKDADLVVRNIATAILDSAHVQQIGWASKVATEAFTGALAGTPVDVSGVGMSVWNLQVYGNGGSPSAWETVLETSENGVEYTPIITHASALGDVLGSTKYPPFGAQFPAGFFRIRNISVTLNGATSLGAKARGRS